MHGVSTRSVGDLVKAMGMTSISKSQEKNDEWAATRAHYMGLEMPAQLGDGPQAKPKRIAAS